MTICKLHKLRCLCLRRRNYRSRRSINPFWKSLCQAKKHSYG